MSSFKVKNVKNSVVVGGNVGGSINNNPSADQKLNMDFGALADELSMLVKKMQPEADTSTKRSALTEVAKAEKAALKHDKQKVKQHLRKAGEWSLEVAKEIGAAMVIEVIKHATDIG